MKRFVPEFFLSEEKMLTAEDCERLLLRWKHSYMELTAASAQRTQDKTAMPLVTLLRLQKQCQQRKAVYEYANNIVQAPATAFCGSVSSPAAQAALAKSLIALKDWQQAVRHRDQTRKTPEEVAALWELYELRCYQQYVVAILKVLEN